MKLFPISGLSYVHCYAPYILEFFTCLSRVLCAGLLRITYFCLFMLNMNCDFSCRDNWDCGLHQLWWYEKCCMFCIPLLSHLFSYWTSYFLSVIFWELILAIWRILCWIWNSLHCRLGSLMIQNSAMLSPGHMFVYGLKFTIETVLIFSSTWCKLILIYIYTGSLVVHLGV